MAPPLVAGRIVAKQSPRADGARAAGVKQVHARFADSCPEVHVELQSPLHKILGVDPEPSYDLVGMKVSNVKANAVVRPPKDGRETKRRVVDKDKAQYTGRQMRPMREMNLNSKKRLNELLKLPTMKIEAAEIHPSRNYDVIPTQNLRVV